MEEKDTLHLNRQPGPSRPETESAAGYRSRVVVKFHDFVQLPYRDRVEEEILRLQIGPWDQVASHFPGITLRRLFTALAPERIQALIDQARDLDRTYQPPNLFSYFAIECPIGVHAESLATALSNWEAVQVAYVESLPAPPPQQINPADDPRFPNQGYLKKAPDGIDAEYAWGFPGGGGKGIQFVDIERGWMLNHEDLAGANISLIWGQNQSTFDHGTASMGVVVAVDNQIGGIGIAPHTSARVASEYDQQGKFDRVNALLASIHALAFGDVLLLEMQSSANEPVEVEVGMFDLIRLATALGVAVIEPAGNGGKSLDAWKDTKGRLLLNRGSNDFRDSGAIMVGSCKSATPHMPVKTSNTGSRVDCYAWGENVDTCSTDSTAAKSDYTTSFGGTSSASAIIAGAALVLQGVAEASLKRRFSAWQVRAILNDPTLGTPAQNPPEVMIGEPGIGVMPDLKAILSKKLKLAPDLYLRDFVGDSGDPHVGAINASPDIILRSAKVADGQKAFGQGSGTENSDTLSKEAKDQQDNYVYVRVRNRGSTPANNVLATVYWSPVATLVLPYLWTEVGSVSIPTVPGGDQLTVPAPILWPAAKVPGPGHYCFVGLIGNVDDPAPTLPEFLDWNQFYRLIRDNNNVTWRNFQVVPNTPVPPSGYAELPFLAPGAPEFARVFGLQVVASLPEEAEAWLEMPIYFADALGLRSPYLRLNLVQGLARLPVNPHGYTLLGEALFPGNSATQLRLLVRIPERFRDQAYELFVRQLYGGEEVGRVTWRLEPPQRIEK